MKSYLRPMVAALALSVAGGAFAAPVTFNFQTGPTTTNNQNSFLFSAGGINLTVTAGSDKVSHRWDGLGVYTGGLDAPDLNSSAFHNSVEKLTFTFSEAVNLTSILFHLFENNLDQGKIVYGSNSLTINKNNDALFSSPIMLTSFTFIPTGLISTYRISGLTVDTISAPAVPVPAAAWLMGSGLVGLAGIARRRARNA